MISMIVYFSS